MYVLCTYNAKLRLFLCRSILDIWKCVNLHMMNRHTSKVGTQIKFNRKQRPFISQRKCWTFLRKKVSFIRTLTIIVHVQHKLWRGKNKQRREITVHKIVTTASHTVNNFQFYDCDSERTERVFTTPWILGPITEADRYNRYTYWMKRSMASPGQHGLPIN